MLCKPIVGCRPTSYHSRPCGCRVSIPCRTQNWCRSTGLTPKASVQQTGSGAAENNVQQKLFSKLDSKLRHDPGSVLGSALLTAGTTVGAGILALPAVTQDAGFIPAATTLTGCCLFSVATGLLVSEVHLNIMRQQGAGNVSLVTMARQTLGDQGAAAASVAYVFLHYALLVAYMSKAGEIAGGVLGLPLLPSAALFAGVFAVLCYGSSQRLLDQLNGALVVLVVASFLGLLVVAGSSIDGGSLLQQGDWSAVPATLPVVALAFVYHNIVPVINTALEGDVRKIRTAICTGVAIPWAMFVSWEAAILGSIGSLEVPQAPAAAVTPLVSVSASVSQQNGASAAMQASLGQQQQLQQRQLARINQSHVSAAPNVVHTAADEFSAWQQQDLTHMPGTAGQQTSLSLEEQLPDVVSLRLTETDSPAFLDGISSSWGMPAITAGCSPGVGCALSRTPMQPLLASGTGSLLRSSSNTDSSISDNTTRTATAVPLGELAAARVADPLAALSASSPVVAPLIQAFSFLAIATSYIGFILGLTDFLADALSLPGGRQSPLPYLITVLPPFGVAVTNPDIFLKALDTAGTYGVLTLFGIMPAAMAWRQRYNSQAAITAETQLTVVPGGKVVLICIGGAAAGVIGNEILQLVSRF